MKNTRAIEVPGVDQKDAPQRQPHDRGIDPEQQRRRCGAHSLDAEAQRQNEAERRQHDNPDQRRAGDGLVKTRDGGGVSDDAGQREAAGHVAIDALHMDAQARIDLRVGRHPARSSPSVRIVIAHAFLQCGADNSTFEARDHEMRGRGALENQQVQPHAYQEP
jgi:hypothetical protein